MSQSSSTKSPPRLSSLSHLQRSSPDEDVEGLGPGAIAISTPSNNSSFSSAGSPSDRTSVTNVESPSPRHHDTKSSSSAPWPADLLESLTQTISVLWQIRAVGPVNYHLLGHLDRFVRRDPPRIELPLGRVDYASLSRLLRLGALTGIADPGHDRDSRREVWQHEAEQQQGTAGRDETPQDKSLGKPLSRQTNALQSAASSIIWALRNTCSSGVRTQDLDLDAEGGSPGISLSPQALLERLGRWVLEKLRIEYDYEEAVFTVRMPSVFHDKSSHSIAECLLLQIRRAVGDTSIEAPRFTACSLPLILTAENIQADVSDDEIGAVAVAPKRSHYHPDAGIFDGASLQPGLILELGWSHPTHRKRAKKYIQNADGHIRCVLLLNIDYREPKDRQQQDHLAPPGIFLTAFQIDADEHSWGAKRFIDNWDLRALCALDSDRELDIPGNLVSEHIPADVHVRVPLRALVDKVDNAIALQQEADRVANGAVQRVSRDILGKRKRTASPEDNDDAGYQTDHDRGHGVDSSRPVRNLRSHAAPGAPGPARSRSSKRRKGA